MYSLLSLSYLLPDDLLNRIRNVVIDELYETTKDLQEAIKNKATSLIHYKNYNLETLNSIKDYPTQIGLFWTGCLDKKFLKSSNFVIESFIKDIFLLPTLVFKSKDDLKSFIQSCNEKGYQFIYKDKQIYYFDRFLPFGTKEHSEMLVFYGKIQPLL